jgi:hypothetical protein
MNAATYMEDLKVLADGDLGSVKLPGQVYDQDPTVSMQ